ncbi:MerR family transcriptional regulator [Polymorphospora sp. NPDC051019]|uniref:MerR family transcriptional regulator n=1 Tax=Polymorphospora sp. NPDC051019 TaxID=3155725 RepID=UPI0034340536
MPLLTIGAFAAAARLSAKALRLYDELGLLPPAAVDGDTGYRYYDQAQLGRARLIARLRGIGMPLARIRAVCDLGPAAAADEVAAYWAHVAADTAVRQRLATRLVEDLSGRVTMHDTALGIRPAARTDAGHGRDTNEDVAYAGTRLLAVADGTRGPGGRASTAAVEALTALETATVDDPLGALADAVARANRAVDHVGADVPAGDGEAATTLTAMLWNGSHLALAHIGDTRAYLLRDGRLSQLTHDHTWVQSQVDEGRLGPQEALTHPQRALLARALTGAAGTEPDLSLHRALDGDRYLLCSDGLSGVVPPAALHTTLRDAGEPARTVDALIALAYDNGAPDNIACVVADVVAD